MWSGWDSPPSQPTYAHGMLRDLRRAWPTVTVLVAGLVTTAALGVFTQSELRASADERLDRRASLVTQVVQSEVDRYEDALTLVASAAGSTRRFTQAQFDAATAPLHTMGLAGATSIAFLAPPVRDDGIEALQRRWRRLGASGLTLTAAPDVDEHVFSIMSEPLDGATQTRTGLDIAAAPAPYAAMMEAAQEDRTSITPPYTLLIDAELPPEERQSSFSITVPVWHAGELRGWVLMGIRGQDFAGGVMARTAQGVIGARLTADDPTGRPVQVAEVDADYPDEPDLSTTSTVAVAQRVWTVTSTAASHRVAPLMRWSPWPLVAVGLLLTMLMAVVVHVLTLRRSDAERRAREADEQLRGVTTCLEDFIWTAEVRLDGTLPLVFVNGSEPGVPGLETLRAGDDLARQLRERTVEDDLPRLEAFLDALSWGDAAEVEVRIRLEDDRVRWVWTRAFPRRDGARVYVDGITSDVHRRKVLDQQRSQFLAIAGHEMRTPLTIIRGYAEHLMDENLPVEVRLRGLDAISRRSRQMELLLSDFFDLSRLESGAVGLERRPVDLDEVVTTACADFFTQARESGLAIELSSRSVVVDADPVRLRQVIDNLLDNALKYSHRGGVVRVLAGPDTGDASRARLVVADDGIGVPHDEVGQIFDRFYRASNAEGHVANGTGLGLAVVAAIVEGHGGTIEASSPPGEGLTVTVTLPVAFDLGGPGGGSSSTVMMGA